MSTTACLCEANSITCHHRSSILKTADLASCKWIDGKGVSPLKLKVPPPRPEPTAHLAVLRDPRHPEWKARPASYQSPALCNTSSIYLKRVVEPEARKKLIKQEEVPQNAAFSLSIAQRRELQHQREEEEIFMQRWTARINELARAGVHESSHSTTSNLSSSPALNPSVNNNVAHGSGARGNVIASSQNTAVIIPNVVSPLATRSIISSTSNKSPDVTPRTFRKIRPHSLLSASSRPSLRYSRIANHPKFFYIRVGYVLACVTTGLFSLLVLIIGATEQPSACTT